MADHHTPVRVRAAHVGWVAERLTARDRAILRSVSQLHVVRGIDLERLHFADLEGRSRSVVRWRVLKRLTDWRVLRPLPRRVGGSLAGSAQLAFALDSAGLHFARRLDGAPQPRRPATLAGRSLAHRLGVSELYAALVERARATGFAVEEFVVEPACWVPDDQRGWLKPDAYVRLVGRSTDHWWIEYDRATEDRSVLRAKVQAYVEFFRRGQPGPEGVMPWVLFSVPTERRLDEVERVVRVARAPENLFHVATHQAAVPLMAEQLSTADNSGVL